jgi:hypothetical protein
VNTLLLLLVLCPILGCAIVAGVLVLALTAGRVARFCLVDARRHLLTTAGRAS